MQAAAANHNASAAQVFCRVIDCCIAVFIVLDALFCCCCCFAAAAVVVAVAVAVVGSCARKAPF